MKIKDLDDGRLELLTAVALYNRAHKKPVLAKDLHPLTRYRSVTLMRYSAESLEWVKLLTRSGHGWWATESPELDAWLTEYLAATAKAQGG